MKNFRLILSALACIAILAGFSSCKKDKNIALTEKCKISTISMGTQSVHISYNSDGRISKIDLGGDEIRSYEYSGNMLTINGTYSGAFSYKQIVTMNSDGFATNSRTENNEEGTSWYNTAYEYNGKELKKATTTSSYSSTPEVTTYTWSGGNLVSGDGVGVAEYYLDKAYQAGDYLNILQIFAGETIIKNKNLIKSSIDGADTTNISYNFDAEGKIISATETTGSTTVTDNYQYLCD